MGLLSHLAAIAFLFLAHTSWGLDKKEFYRLLASENEDTISRAIIALDQSNIKEREAYKAVLLMKKAGIVGNPQQKLAFFKQGVKILEKEISNDKNNGEYRFLRLMIQENAPGILGYKGNLEEDQKFLLNHHLLLEKVVQEAILHYAQSSEILHKEDFKN